MLIDDWNIKRETIKCDKDSNTRINGTGNHTKPSTTIHGSNHKNYFSSKLTHVHSGIRTTYRPSTSYTSSRNSSRYAKQAWQKECVESNEQIKDLHGVESETSIEDNIFDKRASGSDHNRIIDDASWFCMLYGALK